MVDPITPPQAEADDSDSEWHNGNGEAPDRHALSALQLAHRVVAKFPELSKRYQKFIGTVAVVSPALILLTSIVVNRRLHRGESPESILAEITPDEIENAAKEKRAKFQKPKNGNRFSH